MPPPATETPAAPVLRRAAPADLPAIVRRWRELIAVHAGLASDHAPTLYALAPHAEQTYTATVRGQMSDRDCLVLVVETPGLTTDVDAYLTAGLGLRQPVFAQREVGMFFDVAVRPEARRRGLATLLVDEAERWFARRGVQWTQVDFSPGNSLASGFWRRRGFEPVLAEAYRRL